MKVVTGADLQSCVRAGCQILLFLGQLNVPELNFQSDHDLSSECGSFLKIGSFGACLTGRRSAEYVWVFRNLVS
jgi:hypothetical protein